MAKSKKRKPRGMRNPHIPKRGISHNDIVEAEIQKAIEFTVRQYSASLLYCIHNSLGFGQVRAKKFLSKVNEVFNDISKGKLNTEQLLKEMQEKLKIRIE